jgi:8-oxo-dGTP pyrophosphatase MutT (NUDIX family)
MTLPADPAELEELVRAFARGDKRPAEARHASTVVLLRDAPGGPEAYLLRRVKAMSFAAGMHVFPGGAVDQHDATADIAWAGPPASQWGEWFDASEPLARALVCAAVRETFEECGVLLAGESADHLLEDVSTDEWEAEREALESRQHSLSELLARRGLVLRTDLLRPYAHWITPDIEPKRFDTRFFLAKMPAGQVCRDVGGEADERRWVRVRDALAEGLVLMPPTHATLRDLAAYDDVATALDDEREILVVAPRMVVDAAGDVRLVVPGDADYPVSPETTPWLT